MATHDTPEERNEKAAELAAQVEMTANAVELARIAEAKRLAHEVRRFRWEVRTFYVAMFLYLVIGHR